MNRARRRVANATAPLGGSISVSAYAPGCETTTEDQNQQGGDPSPFTWLTLSIPIGSR